MNTTQKNRPVVFVIIGAGQSQTFIVDGEQSAPATLQPGERRLGYGDIVNIKRIGQRLRVISGNAWITFDGEDMVVLAGQEIILEPGMDAAVVSALENEPLVYRIYGGPGK